MPQEVSIDVIAEGGKRKLKITAPITIKNLKTAIESKAHVPYKYQCLFKDGKEWTNYTDEFICTTQDLKELKVPCRPTLEAQGDYKSFPVNYSPQYSTDTDSGGSSTDLGKN